MVGRSQGSHRRLWQFRRRRLRPVGRGAVAAGGAASGMAGAGRGELQPPEIGLQP